MTYCFYKTKDVDLTKYDLEGTLKVRGAYQKVFNDFAERVDGMDPESPRALAIQSLVFCTMCIVEAPFDITEENVGQLPIEVTKEVMEIAMGVDQKLPLD